MASIIGFITLFGIATRNRMMLISHVRHLVEFASVSDLLQAVVRGASERIAVILMTTLATGRALFPGALGMGKPGSEMQTPMALVILFGLLLSTALNMVVVPAACCLCGWWQRRLILQIWTEPEALLTDNNAENLRRGRRVAAVSIAASCLLSFSNVWIGYAAGSTSVVAAGFEFLGDVLASILVLVGMIMAAKPADADHPYGHGRIEILAGLSVGMILAAGGFGICYRSLQKITEQHPPPRLYSIWPLVAAIVIRTGMSTVKFRIGRRIGSASLIADAWNDTVDILSAAAALCALGLTLYDPNRFLPADHYGGFAVGLFVIYTGVRVLRETSLDLIDTMPSQKVINRIREVAAEVTGVEGIEKCYARKTGLQYHVDIHVEVNPGITVAESHDIASNVRAHIRNRVREIADVMVHIEPRGLAD